MIYLFIGSRVCSECSCENCDHHLDEEGPNQVNFLATTNEISGSNLNVTDTTTHESNHENTNENTPAIENHDLQQQLSNVLGALESRIEDRNKYTIPENEIYNDQCKDDVESGLVLDSHDVSIVFSDSILC